MSTDLIKVGEVVQINPRDLWVVNPRVSGYRGRDAEILAPRDDGSSVEASNEIAAVYGDLRALKAQASNLNEQIAEREDKLKAFMCEAAYLRLGDRVCATWKASSRTSFDQAALKDADPELYKKFTKQTDVRRFVLK